MVKIGGSHLLFQPEKQELVDAETVCRINRHDFVGRVKEDGPHQSLRTNKDIDELLLDIVALLFTLLNAVADYIWRPIFFGLKRMNFYELF